MAYPKQVWKDLPDRSTPLNAKRLNHMEDGIYQNSLAVDSLSTKGLKYAYRYGTPDSLGLLEIEGLDSSYYVISAYYNERGNGYVIPYKYDGKWYLKCMNYNGAAWTSYVGITYIYAEKIDFGQ